VLEHTTLLSYTTGSFDAPINLRSINQGTRSILHLLMFSNQIRFPSGRHASDKYQLNLKEKVIGLNKRVTG